MSKREPLPYVDRGRPGELRYSVRGELLQVKEPEAVLHKPLTKEALREQPESELADARAALEHWANWAKSSLAGIGWPPRTLLARIIEFGVLGAAQHSSGSLLVVGEMVEYDELCGWVEAALMRLTLVERNVAVRVYMHYESREESARAMGMTTNNLGQVLYRVHRSVRDYLDGRRAAKRDVAL